MQCLWLEQQQLDVRDVPAPTPGPGEALIRVRLAGICGAGPHGSSGPSTPPPDRSGAMSILTCFPGKSVC